MYRRDDRGWIDKIRFILLDMLSGQIALIAAYWLRFGGLALVYRDDRFRNVVLWLLLSSALVSLAFDTMRDAARRKWPAELRQTFLQCAFVFGIINIALFSFKDAEKISRIVIWLTILLYFAISFGLRSAVRAFLRRRQGGDNARAMLLIADADSAAAVLEQFKAHPEENIRVTGIVPLGDQDSFAPLRGIPLVAQKQDAANYICREWIDEVYVCVSRPDLMPQALIEQCHEMGVTVHLQLMQATDGKQVIEPIAGQMVLTSSMNISSPLPLIIKRAFDILGGLALSLLAILAILIAGPIIYKASPGPLIYAQERIGRNGKKFKMYKLRSMYMDADARKQELMDKNRVSSGLMFKLDFDPRIIGNETLADGTQKTGIGDFIRRYSIDELPQGFNVLMGQMSLVGTRPPTVDEWEKYELHHRARLAIRPGITGMWQVSGRSDITDFEEVTRLDTKYIANWTLLLDLKILLKTFSAVFGHQGAR